MATSFTVDRAERSKLRRIPFLPRTGVTSEIAGRQFTLKTAPLLETFLNWRDVGFTVANFKRVVADELSEICFPQNKSSPVVSLKGHRSKSPAVKGVTVKKS